MLRTFSEAAFYATRGLSVPKWDDALSTSVSSFLTDVEKRCILHSALKEGTREELEAKAKEHFGDDPIFFRDEDGNLRETFFSC